MDREDIKIIELTFVNAFLLRLNDGFILIDTGLSMHWEKLEAELIAAGCFPDKLRLVVITHGDFDHTGNCSKLQQKYSLKIAMHQGDLAMAENGYSPKRQIRTLYAKILTIIRKLFKNKFSFEKFKPDLYLEDGQNLNEYGLDAKIVHIPGHTKGSIGVITDNGILFAGDMFVNRGKPDTANYVEDAEELKNSLAKLKAMNIKTIYPGHGKSFEIGQIEHRL